MAHSPQQQSSDMSGTFRFLCLGLVLLCGFITWSGATPRVANGLEEPLFVDQVEQLALAGTGDQLRSRPGFRKEGPATGSNLADDPDGAGLFPTAGASTGWRLTTAGFDLPSSANLPVPERYRLPIPREPPKA